MENEKLFEILEAIPDISQDDEEEWGRWHYANCPCGGTIKAIRSVNYGHLHAKCDKCGFELHE